MFPSVYFAKTYFPGRYFPPNFAVTVVPVITGGGGILNMPYLKRRLKDTEEIELVMILIMMEIMDD